MGTTGGASQWNFVPLPMVLFLDYLRQWRRLEINFTGLQAATFSIATSTKVDHFYFANNTPHLKINRPFFERAKKSERFKLSLRTQNPVTMPAASLLGCSRLRFRKAESPLRLKKAKLRWQN